MNSKLQALIEKKQEYIQEMKDHGEKVLKEVFFEFFQNNPEIESLSWQQYTDYFNDGDPCNFHIHLDYGLHIKLTDYEDLINPEELRYGDEEDKELYKTYQKKYETNIDELTSSLYGVEDLLEMTFGDHVEVTATKEGFEVEKYTHHD